MERPFPRFDMCDRGKIRNMIVIAIAMECGQHYDTLHVQLIRELPTTGSLVLCKSQMALVWGSIHSIGRFLSCVLEKYAYLFNL